MLKGKDLLHKGHTLECWYNSIEPSPIIYQTRRIESIRVKKNFKIKTDKVKSTGFNKIKKPIQIEC